MTPKVITNLEEVLALEEAGKLAGFFRIPDGIYHDPRCPGVSSSVLKNMLRSPAHAKAAQAEPMQSSALELGTLTHMAILEPERFADEVIVAPKFDRRTTAGKEAAAAFEQENGHRKLISPADHLDVLSMRSAVMASKFARQHLEGGVAELAAFWIDPDTGVLCKAKADYLKPGLILDLKTTFNASPRGFASSVNKYNYGLSAALYRDGFQALGWDVNVFAWIVVEKKKPFAVAFYTATRDVLMAGRAEYQRALKLWKQCTVSGDWPAYEQAFVPLAMPRWDEEELEEEVSA